MVTIQSTLSAMPSTNSNEASGMEYSHRQDRVAIAHSRSQLDNLSALQSCEESWKDPRALEKGRAESRNIPCSKCCKDLSTRSVTLLWRFTAEDRSLQREEWQEMHSSAIPRLLEKALLLTRNAYRIPAGVTFCIPCWRRGLHGMFYSLSTTIPCLAYVTEFSIARGSFHDSSQLWSAL